jgi:hypothetical protein
MGRFVILMSKGLAFCGLGKLVEYTLISNNKTALSVHLELSALMSRSSVFSAFTHWRSNCQCPL